MIISRVREPASQAIFARVADGRWEAEDASGRALHQGPSGVVDLVERGTELWREREHYDAEYSSLAAPDLSKAALASEWTPGGRMPWRRTLLDSLGPLEGKKALLVGNGESVKELHFLTLGASLVFTDLSVVGVERVKRSFEASSLFEQYSEAIEFYAVDALNLPFLDEQFDVVYGCAFVHHLEDPRRFLSEVVRCLKPGGRCRFLDQAHSPTWALLSRTVLLPFKKWSYWKHPRSPADVKANERGGYLVDEVVDLGRQTGFHGHVFKRESFFLRIVSRHYGKLVEYNRNAMRFASPVFWALGGLDSALGNTKWMRRNALILTWGFDKK